MNDAVEPGFFMGCEFGIFEQVGVAEAESVGAAEQVGGEQVQLDKVFAAFSG